MMKPHFKSIKGYRNKYFISNTGIVVNRKGKVIKPFGNKGNLRINLRIDNRMDKNYVIYLFAKHFIPNQQNLPFVINVSDNKRDLSIDNIRWSLQSEKQIQCIKNFEGKRSKAPIVPIENVYKMREEYKKGGVSVRDLEKVYHIDKSTVSRAINGKRRFKNI